MLPTRDYAEALVVPRSGWAPEPVVEWQFPYGIGTQGKTMLVHTGDYPLISGRTRPATREQAHVTAYGRPIVSRARASSGRDRSRPPVRDAGSQDST
ncbi:hypothetical protein ACFY20_46495 [Streptomyces sp. NPDC001312]|uniref:hypothetical protein n=1 Tax=Streptomyces sp. NPDC001312 TaxID=3364561 RepID=UPI0036BA1892